MTRGGSTTHGGAEPLFDVLFTGAPIGLAFLDPGLRVAYANDALAEIGGVVPSILVGRRVDEAFPYLEPTLAPLLEEVLRTGERLVARQFDAPPADDTDSGRAWLVDAYRVDGRADQPLGVGLTVHEVTDLVRVRAALGASEEERETLARRIAAERALLEAVVRQMPAGVIIAEAPSGRLILGNEQLERIWRHEFLPSADVEQYREYRGFHPDERPYEPHEWPLARSVTSGDVIENETIGILRGDGTTGVIEVSSAPIRDPDGRIIAGVISAHDITERHRAQAAGRFLAEASHILASSLDYETTLTSVARLAVPWLADWCAVDMADATGAIRRLAVAHVDPAKIALAHELQERFPPDPNATTGVPNVLRTGEPELYEEIGDDLLVASARSPEQLAIARELGLVSAMIVPLTARGQTLGAISFVTAESGRHYGASDLEVARELAGRAALAVDNARLFRRAQETETRYRAIFEGVGDSIVVSDLDGRVVDANPVTVRMLGYTVEELRAMPRGALTSLGAAWVGEQLAEIREAGEWRGEVDVRRKDGTLLSVEVHVTRLDSPGGAVLVSTARDITERRAGERMQHEFAAMVGHELKNPLAALSGFAQLMRRRGTYSQRAVDAIVQQAARLDRIVGDLLDVSRFEAGRLDLQRAPVDLVDVVRACMEQVQVLDPDRTPALEAPDGAVVGRWDRGRLEQVVYNLLSNAVKYSPDDAPIVVRVERADGEARAHVIDAGPGIPPDALPRLFRRFARLEGAAATAPGLGLGLYISKALVEAHGGRIWAESEPGRGATFSFALPLDPPAGLGDGDGHC